MKPAIIRIIKNSLRLCSDFCEQNTSVLLGVLTLVCAGILAYRNAFGAPFLFDDIPQILMNTKIQSLQWPWVFLENNRRPLLYLSLALDFHAWGFNSFGYHLSNIRTHLLTSILFFLLIRKTLLLGQIPELIRRNAFFLALSSAILWMLHPVHTQAVTYIIQRAESLMGMFFVASVYCASQYFSNRKAFWFAACGLLSLCAGLTKEVALALPLLIFFYDRTFFSNGFRDAFKRHRWLYAALSLTWFVMIYLYLTTSPEKRLTAGFGMQGMPPWLYAINQPLVILRYLMIIFWPADLVFDYHWPPRTALSDLLPSVMVVTLMIAGLIIRYRAFPKTTFLALSFFLVLLPSSSVIPLKDLIFEYRIYLSSMAVAVLFCVGLVLAAERIFHARSRGAAAVCAVIVFALILGGMTFQRNKIYADEAFLWSDTIRKQPLNARAFNNLGEYLMRQDRYEEAKPLLFRAAEISTAYSDVYSNLATVLGRERKPQEALQYALQAIEINSEDAVAHNNAGAALSQMDRFAEAVPYFRRTLELDFVREGVVVNLGVALANSGDPKEGAKVLEKGMRLFPGSKEIEHALEQVYAAIRVPENDPSSF